MLHHPVMLLLRCALFRVGIILGMCVNFNITRREGHMGGKVADSFEFGHFYYLPEVRLCCHLL